MDIKALLNEKKRVFRSGDREAGKRVQKQLSVNIREGKEAYRRKLEQRLQQNDTREVSRGMRTITGYKPSSQTVDGNIDRTDELNCLFNRFFNRFFNSTGGCLFPFSLCPLPRTLGSSRKFSNDSAVFGCIRREDVSEYQRVVDSFVDW